MHMETSTRAADLARRAAERMSEHGHCKRTLEDDEGRVCFLGALYASGTNAQALHRVQCLASEILRERGVDGPFRHPFLAVDWNNRPEVTGEDVILLFKECAARLDA